MSDKVISGLIAIDLMEDPAYWARVLPVGAEAIFQGEIIHKSEAGFLVKGSVAKDRGAKPDYWRTISGHKVPFVGTPGSGTQVGGMPIGAGGKPAAGKKKRGGGSRGSSTSGGTPTTTPKGPKQAAKTSTGSSGSSGSGESPTAPSGGSAPTSGATGGRSGLPAVKDRTVVAGYTLTGPRTQITPGVFVQRSAGRGKPWLRFMTKHDGDGAGYYVTSFPTKRAAIQSMDSSVSRADRDADIHEHDHGKYRIKKKPRGGWSAQFTDLQGNEHEVAREGHHDPHPLLGRVVSADHGTKRDAVAAMERHVKRQKNQAQHGDLNNNNVLSTIKNKIARKVNRGGEQGRHLSRMIAVLERGGDRREVVAAGGPNGQQNYLLLREQAHQVAKQLGLRKSMKVIDLTGPDCLEKARNMPNGAYGLLQDGQIVVKEAGLLQDPAGDLIKGAYTHRVAKADGSYRYYYRSDLPEGEELLPTEPPMAKSNPDLMADARTHRDRTLRMGSMVYSVVPHHDPGPEGSRRSLPRPEAPEYVAYEAPQTDAAVRIGRDGRLIDPRSGLRHHKIGE